MATGGAARRRSRPTRNPWKRDPPIPPPADIQQSRARQEAVLPFLSYRSLTVAALLEESLPHDRRTTALDRGVVWWYHKRLPQVDTSRMEATR